MGLKTRKKKRTRFEPVSDAQKIKNEIASKLPRILVVNRGNVTPATRHLMQDVKDMFSPHIIQTIKVLRNHKLTDLAKGAKELDLRHCLLFSQTDVGLYMKVATMPDGPTITFRITEYTLSGDIKSTQKKPISLSEMALYSPAALIMNNISPQSGPKHLQAMASSIQMMFAKFSPEHVTTAAIKRTCMFNYNAAEDEMEVRHYAIKLGASSDNKFLKRIANGNKIPNLNKLKNIDEAMDKVGLLSESEGEEDIKVEVTEDSKANVKDDKSKVKASLPAPKTVEKSLRLKDVGPRMSWQLVKIESGFMAGDVVYHKTETRTKEAKEDRDARRDQIKTEKKLRREQQEANVQRKLDLAEAHRQRCIAGMQPTGEEADSEHETSDEEAKQDDEAKYYAEEVGEEPSADLAARMTLTRKDKPQENWEEEVSKKKAQEEEKWDERRKQLKAKYRKLDAKRKTNKPRSFKKRLARKIKSEVKDRNAHKESEKRKREAEETAPTVQKSNKKAKK